MVLITVDELATINSRFQYICLNWYEQAFCSNLLIFISSDKYFACLIGIVLLLIVYP